MTEVTQILRRIEQGEPIAAERLLPLVYDELKKLAAARLAHELPGQTLQPTALVHEAYVRLVDVKQAQEWESRGHFFAAAAEAMRRILVDAARRKRREKHGGDRKRVALRRRRAGGSGSPSRPRSRSTPPSPVWPPRTHKRRGWSNCGTSPGYPWPRRRKCLASRRARRTVCGPMPAPGCTRKSPPQIDSAEF